MSESTSSIDPFIDDLGDDVTDDTNTSFGVSGTIKTLGSRSRLEEKLAQRSLEKDVREFDFDL